MVVSLLPYVYQTTTSPCSNGMVVLALNSTEGFQFSSFKFEKLFARQTVKK